MYARWALLGKSGFAHGAKVQSFATFAKKFQLLAVCVDLPFSPQASAPPFLGATNFEAAFNNKSGFRFAPCSPLRLGDNYTTDI